MARGVRAGRQATQVKGRESKSDGEGVASREASKPKDERARPMARRLRAVRQARCEVRGARCEVRGTRCEV
jgi:hypothetical protein